MEHWLWIILAALFFGKIQTSTCFLYEVIQEQGDVIAAEGDTVTLGCRYETSDPGPTLFWYKQDGNNSPKFLLSPVSGFSAHIDKTEKRVDLEISSAAVTDSAVYYCALQPTVTGNTKPLYKNLWSKDNRILHNIH
uniref:Ig-like domain-containing protein n=1 Tax=Oreochromis aureus TaxID=47969 RepID=A0AAZ1XHY8_OREAU